MKATRTVIADAKVKDRTICSEREIFSCANLGYLSPIKLFKSTWRKEVKETLKNPPQTQLNEGVKPVQKEGHTKRLLSLHLRKHKQEKVIQTGALSKIQMENYFHFIMYELQYSKDGLMNLI